MYRFHSRVTDELSCRGSYLIDYSYFPLITNIVKVAEQIKKDPLKVGVDGSASFIDFQLFHFPTRIIPEHGVFGNCLCGKWNLDAFGPMSKEIF